MSEPCLCGGTIRAHGLDDLPDAVRRHQATQQHRHWQAGRWGGKPREARAIEPFQQVACIGVGDRGCLAMIPPDRVRCYFCIGTLRLALA